MGDEIIWDVPVHRSLVKPVFWGGVPRLVLISEILVAILAFAILKTFTIVILMAIVHMIFRYFSQNDPVFADVFFRSIKHDGYYRG